MNINSYEASKAESEVCNHGPGRGAYIHDHHSPSWQPHSVMHVTGVADQEANLSCGLTAAGEKGTQ